MVSAQQSLHLAVSQHQQLLSNPQLLGNPQYLLENQHRPQLSCLPQPQIPQTPINGHQSVKKELLTSHQHGYFA